MAQDIRDLFKEEQKTLQDKMPDNHQVRFLDKLNKALPVGSKSRYNGLRMAASIVLLLGLSYGGYKYFQPSTPITPTNNNVAATEPVVTKTLGDVSPGLKKVEDYYLASINLELSKIKYAPETKELFDRYIEQLNFLNNEYRNLSIELTENGPSELTVNALIDNLKYRLNLLYRLREQLQELTASDTPVDEASQSI